MLSNASSARLVDREGGGKQSAIGVCFRRKVCFERDRPSLYIFEMSSPLSQDGSKRNAHEYCAVGNGGCGQFVVVELRMR